MDAIGRDTRFVLGWEEWDTILVCVFVAFWEGEELEIYGIISICNQDFNFVCVVLLEAIIFWGSHFLPQKLLV